LAANSNTGKHLTTKNLDQNQISLRNQQQNESNLSKKEPTEEKVSDRNGAAHKRYKSTTDTNPRKIV
jgi:hypothetical protein